MRFLRFFACSVLRLLASGGICAVFLLAAGQAAQGDTERVSVDSAEAQAGGASSASV